MTDWKKVRLGEILTESKVEAENSGSETRLRVLLNAKGVIQRPITKETAGATKYFARKSGQFIYGKQNLHKGAFGIIPEKLNGFTSSSDLPAFDVSSGCLPEWIVYFLRQGDFYLSLIDIAKGAATKRIQPKALFEVEIPLPEIKVQREIIREFKRREETQNVLLNEIQTQKSLLNQLKQATLQEAIQGKLTRDWRAQNPEKITGENSAAVLLENIKAEKARLVKEKKIKKEKPLPSIEKEEIPFDLPEGWVWCRLGEVISLISGQDFDKTKFNEKPETGIPYLTGASNLQNGKVILNRWTKKPLSIAFKGDLLLTCKGSGVGKMAFLNIDKVHIARQLMAIQSNSIELSFIKFLLETRLENFRKDAKSLIPGIDRTIVRSIILPFPSLNEQKAIVEKVEVLMEKCAALELEIFQSEQNVQMLMQAVLKEAFEGEKKTMEPV